MQVQRSSPVHDVVVIGSGAGGGTMVKVLTDLGVNVLLLEAGPMINPARDFKEHHTPYQYPHRGAGEHAESYTGRGRAFGFFGASYGGWTLDGEPYTVAEGEKFEWFRSRVMGGRTLHYGRISLRFSDYDFKPHSFDGLGTDWPISYEDMSPYYDKAEAFIGITGTKEGLRTAPDGIFQGAVAPRVHELLIQKACNKLNIPCVPSRLAIILKPTNGRPPCHYCGQCGRGCIPASNYSSLQVQIMPAMKSGRLKIIDNAMVRELITDDSGKVTAISYIDKKTRAEQRVRCRTVVVAGGACETARLLLNSKAARHPNGLANSSGVVGRYLTDNTGYSLSAYIPALEGMPRHDNDGMGGMHLYVPWWLLDKKDKPFPRGYHIELGGGYGMPAVGSFHGTCSRNEGYGAPLKKAIRDSYGTVVTMSGRGEMVPNDKSYCEIDPHTVDQYGIPVLRFHFQWNEYEPKQTQHMHDTFSEIYHTMGGQVVGPGADGWTGVSVGGVIIHELGTVRMGDDSRTSALNKYCQAHDVRNLFVADAAPFLSNPDKNPTLTICALAWRTADYLTDQLRRGDV